MFDFPVTLAYVFNPVFTAKAAEQLGEEATAVQRAMDGAIPVVLSGLLYRASFPGDLSAIISMARDASTIHASHIANGLPVSLSGKGEVMLQTLFGAQKDAIVSSVANYASVQPASAAALLQAIAPIAMGIAGQQSGGTDLTAPSLLLFLNSQQEKILASIPAGLGLSTILGINNLGDIGRRLSDVTGSVTGDAPQEKDEAVSSWFWVMVALAVVFLLLWYLFKGCGRL